ncbi:hypothetical protein E2562_016170 [Oryza meyeriana var. granulata]|uniref:Uncharacterized protein n=1 Tax=Oryza meyeriana var. granulata TaxID=110450 RepID=A0A6G1F8P0_9ORYZ|nr:hypothetical protein E2562_016170 [Oryza meyeriana var. granulata]
MASCPAPAKAVLRLWRCCSQCSALARRMATVALPSASGGSDGARSALGENHGGDGRRGPG